MTQGVLEIQIYNYIFEAHCIMDIIVGIKLDKLNSNPE